MNTVYYHGTNKIFDEFKIPLVSENIKSPLGLLGIYFTRCPKLASDFTKVSWTNENSKYKKGAQVIPVYLNFKNPLILSAETFLMLSGRGDKYLNGYREKCIQEGYDSIIFEKPKIEDPFYNEIISEFPTEQVVIFNNSNIKNIYHNLTTNLCFDNSIYKMGL